MGKKYKEGDGFRKFQRGERVRLGNGPTVTARLKNPDGSYVMALDVKANKEVVQIERMTQEEMDFYKGLGYTIETILEPEVEAWHRATETDWDKE